MPVPANAMYWFGNLGLRTEAVAAALCPVLSFYGPSCRTNWLGYFQIPFF